MLHVFLVILKIIGIILAVLLGILLFVALSLLFWPISYKAEGSYKGTFQGRALVRFWGPVIWLRILYEEKISYRLRIFGIPVLDSNRTSSRGDSRKKSGKKKTSKRKKSYLDEEDHWESDDSVTVDGAEHEPKSEEADSDGERDLLSADSDGKRRERKKQKHSSSEESVAQKAGQVKDKLHDLAESIRNMKSIWKEEAVQTGIGKIKKELLLFVKKIKPRKLRWYVRFGFEDPATTGQTLAVLSVLRGMWGRELYVHPDFENKVLETEFQAKGYVQGIRLARLIWKYYFDKDIKYVFEKGKGARRK